MPCDLTTEANRMIDRLTRGDLDAILPHYAFPAAVYFGERILVLNTPDDFMRAITAYRAILVRNGLRLASTELCSTPRLRRRTFTVTVANSYFDGTGGLIGTSRIRYFLERAGTCARIRLVEYQDWPFPSDIAADAALKSLCAAPAGRYRAPRAARAAYAAIH